MPYALLYLLLILIIIRNKGAIMSFRTFILSTAIVTLTASIAVAAPAENNNYNLTAFVANKASYGAKTVDKRFINAWGVATRPAGAGGHFWVTAKDISYEYIGDVQNSEDEALRTLHQNDLKEVKLPVGGEDAFATGVVFCDSKDSFVITQKTADATDITAPAKFLFASDGGIISAWTERKKEDGSFDRPTEALTVIDQSDEGAQFFGLASNAAYNRIYAADFGAQPGIKVFDAKFQPEDVTFDMPFDENKNGKVDAGEYAPFNVQALRTPAGESHIFVTYAKTQACPEEEVAKGSCNAGELFVGEEDTSIPGNGRVAEFTEDGKLVATLNDGGQLSAPWGVAYAPADFGALSNALLVGNFGSGTIAAYDAQTLNFIDVLRDANGKAIKVDKVWGLVFGNGESLGDKNALYFAAGPDDEQDGLFGSLRPAK